MSVAQFGAGKTVAVDLDAADSQALASLSERTMALDVLVQDGVVTVTGETGAAVLTPQALKAPA